MSKYIASATIWTLQQRDSKPSEFAGKLLAAPLLVVGTLLLASGLHATDVSQLAIGVLSLAGATALATTR
jgi:hypothetical protein